MLFRSEKGFTGIDIAISVIIITIFISMMANLISNIILNSKKMERTEIATAYAVQEIEKIKAQGYRDNYNEKGIYSEEILNEEDIMDNSNTFTGYSKKTTIKDYVFIKSDTTKQKNKLKEITVEVSFKLGKDIQKVNISTYVTE